MPSPDTESLASLGSTLEPPSYETAASRPGTALPRKLLVMRAKRTSTEGALIPCPATYSQAIELSKVIFGGFRDGPQLYCKLEGISGWVKVLQPQGIWNDLREDPRLIEIGFFMSTSLAMT